MGQSARSCLLGRYDPPDPGKIGDGDSRMGMTPPIQVGDGTPRQIGDRDGDGDRGVRAAAAPPWCQSLSVLT